MIQERATERRDSGERWTTQDGAVRKREEEVSE